MAIFTDDETKLIIQHYKKNKFLWDSEDCDYMNKSRRNTSLKEFAEHMRALCGKEITVEAIKSKWHCLKSTFGREYKRINTPGSEGKVRWHLYKSLEFLNGIGMEENNEIVLINDNLEFLKQSLSEETETTYQEVPQEIEIVEMPHPKRLKLMNSATVVQNQQSTDTESKLPTVIESCMKVVETAVKALTKKTVLDEVDSFCNLMGCYIRKLPEPKRHQVMIQMQTMILNEIEYDDEEKD